MTFAISEEEFLAHYGVKGMRWGVRKDRTTVDLSNTGNSKGVKVRADGSIDIPAGASLQRLVRSNGKSLPLKDITYASFTDYDNSRYIKAIGGKGFFGGGRDRILSMTATQAIKAPSKEEATRLTSKLMLEDPAFRKRNTTMLGTEINKKELEQIRKDPLGKTAQTWYEMTNQKMTFDAEFDPDAPHVQKVFRKTLEDAGYNAIRDENDVSAGISKAPIIIFSPEKSLKVITTTDITDELRRANKEKLKAYKQQGKEWIDTQIYGA